MASRAQPRRGLAQPPQKRPIPRLGQWVSTRGDSAPRDTAPCPGDLWLSRWGTGSGIKWVGGQDGCPTEDDPTLMSAARGGGGGRGPCVNYLEKALSLIPAHAGHLGLEPGLHAGGLQIALCLETQMPVTLGFPTLPHPHPERPPRRWWPTWRSEGRGLRNSCVLQLWDQREDLQGQVRDENLRPLLRSFQEIPDGESRALQQGWALGRHWLSSEVQARRGEALGPRSLPLPLPHPLRVPRLRARPSVCPWRRAVFTSPAPVCRAGLTRKGLGKTVLLTGRSLGPWLPTRGRHGAQAAPHPDPSRGDCGFSPPACC